MPSLFTRLRIPISVWPSSPRSAPKKVRTLPSRRGAATAVIVGFAAFLAAQGGLGWAIDTERSPLRDPIYFDKFEKLRQHPAFFPAVGSPHPTTVMFIGSSRTLNAVDAGAAGQQLTQELGRPIEVFNFGQAGAGPVTNAIYLRRLLKAGAKPDFVVIEIHPTFLAGQRPDQPEMRWLLSIRLRPEELPVARAMRLPLPDTTAHGPRGFLASWYEYRFLLLDRHAPYMLMNDQRLNGGHQSDEHGFTRLPSQIDPQTKMEYLSLALRQYAYYFAGYRPNGSGVQGLRDALEVCTAAGIPAALALLPESKEWLGWYDPIGLQELDVLTAQLAKDYGVPVFDGRKWVPDEKICDGHHLMGIGADVFTDRIVRDALVPWIARSRPTP